MNFTHDVIVLGTGGVGSSALSHLAARGLVVGLDQHPPAHGFGSSHGQSRIIRKAYFEHPDYVPLLERAYALWDELSENRAGLICSSAPGCSKSDRVTELSFPVFWRARQGTGWPLRPSRKTRSKKNVSSIPSAGGMRGGI